MRKRKTKSGNSYYKILEIYITRLSRFLVFLYTTSHHRDAKKKTEHWFNQGKSNSKQRNFQFSKEFSWKTSQQVSPSLLQRDEVVYLRETIVMLTAVLSIYYDELRKKFSSVKN